MRFVVQQNNQEQGKEKLNYVVCVVGDGKGDISGE